MLVSSVKFSTGANGSSNSNSSSSSSSSSKSNVHTMRITKPNSQKRQAVGKQMTLIRFTRSGVTRVAVTRGGN